MSIFQNLKELDELKKQGIITEEEFQVKKNEYLKQNSTEECISSFWDIYKDFWKKYFSFDGCVNRSDYWKVTLLNFVICCIPFVGELYGLVITIPSINFCTRRLHDINKSGWWQLISLIPLFGIFYLLYLTLKSSDIEENKFLEK